MTASVAAFLATYLGGTAAVWAVAVNIAISVAISYAIAGVFRPRQRRLADVFGDSTLTSLASDAEWRVVYGQARLGGVLRFRHATDTLGPALRDEKVNVPATSPFTVKVSQAATYLSTDEVRRYITTGEDESWETFTAVGSIRASCR